MKHLLMYNKDVYNNSYEIKIRYKLKRSKEKAYR